MQSHVLLRYKSNLSTAPQIHYCAYSLPCVMHLHRIDLVISYGSELCHIFIAYLK